MMKLLLLLSVCLTAVFISTNAQRVGRRPSSTNCFIESIRHRFFAFNFRPMNWRPRCMGNQYAPEQCTNNQCWCVTPFGRSLSDIYHAAGTVDCTTCKANQVFQRCKLCTTRCDQRGQLIACPAICTPGCGCPAGQFLDGDRCVEGFQCPTQPCKANQVFQRCKLCTTRCDQRGQPNFCPAICRPGCSCPAGQFLDGDRCVEGFQCPTQPCDLSLGEVFTRCAPPCDATCDEPNIPCSLQESCTNRCACPRGLFRNSDNVCVTPQQCPIPCPATQIFKPCIDCIERSCDQVDEPLACFGVIGVCRSGCVCPDDKFLNEYGRCVTADECRRPFCEGGQIFRTCRGCPRRCEDRANPILCPAVCIAGCSCPTDKPFLSNGVCVEESQCDVEPPVCEGGKVYSECTGCPETCDSRNNPIQCLAVCVPGCACPSDRPYEHNGVCVAESACPVCPGNQVFRCLGCVQQTCDEVGQPQACYTGCQQGCGCLDGQYLLGDICVDASVCPPRRCDNGKEFTTCGGCDTRCDQIGDPIPCATVCRVGCFCPAGTFLLGERCVRQDQCPQPDCENGMVFSTCGSCITNCEDRFRPQLCTLECRVGCTCPPDTFLFNGACVTESECPPLLFDDPNSCPGVVNKGDYVAICDADGLYETTVCADGECFCVDRESGDKLKGTTRNEENFDLDCDFLGDCPINMEYSSCATSCPPTCGNPSPRCIRICAIDCQCRDGLVRASETNLTCIERSECPAPHSCGFIRASATSPISIRCDADGSYAPEQCRDGVCWCVEKDGTTIPETETQREPNSPFCHAVRDCDSENGKVWSSCAPSCDATCPKFPTTCSEGSGCSPKCICKPGLVTDPNDSNRCIELSQCRLSNPPCNEYQNEVFSRCAQSCDATCEQPAIPCSLTKICEQRCTCPFSYLRDENNVCVEASQCKIKDSRTECQKQSVVRHGILDAFIAECDENNNFLRRQCYGFLQVCWCADPVTGEQIDGSRFPQRGYDIDCDTFSAPPPPQGSKP